MYAIIEDSGTQIKVAAGDVIDIDLRELEEGAKTPTVDRGLLVGGAEAEQPSKVGTPDRDGAGGWAAGAGGARAAWPGVAGVGFPEPEHRLTLLGQPGQVIFPQVSALIAQHGWVVKELDVERGRLDEVFRNLTRGESL